MRDVLVELCIVLLLCLAALIDGKQNVLKGYESLGCWTNEQYNANKELIPSVEHLEDVDELDGVYWERDQAVLKCAWFAKDHGYSVFAIRNSGECLTSDKAWVVYTRYGQSDDCKGGEGGHGAMDVYRLKGTLQDIELFEGDVLLTKQQRAKVISIPFGDVLNDAIYQKIDEKWPGKTIPYFVHPRYKNHQLERKLLAGLKPWEEKTCIKFVPKKKHRDWVEFVREKNPKSRRCASAIGHNGSKQQMRMGDLCPSGSVIHEWGHSIGLWHTHSRSDRDDYVKILWKNIFGGWRSQFEKHPFNLYNVEYDYNSIMHYGKNFFAKVSKDKSRLLNTIKTLDKKYQNKIGQREFLSKGDIDMVNTMYGCPDFPYMWRPKHWSKCSALCGSGIQRRVFICAKKDGKKSSDMMCKNSKRPRSTRRCYGRQCSQCPPNWHKLNEACYKINSEKAGWKKAAKNCLDQGAGLVTFRDAEEERQIRRFIAKDYLQTVFFWIGAEYNPVEGVFKWTDDTDLVYSDWKAGEPRLGMDCAIMFNRQKWGTDQCLMKRNYICKKELKDYIMPVVKLNSQSSRFKWYAGAWGECSVTCGNGQQNRKTYCAGPDGVEVHYSNCTGTPPDAWKDCKNPPCPSPYKWTVKKWGDCSVTCGGGWQRREVICAKEDGIPTSYEMCNHTKQPEYQQKCNEQPCPPKRTSAAQVPQQPLPPQQPQPPQQPLQQQQWPNIQPKQQPQQWPNLQPQWKTSYWTRCSVTCGTGTQVRHVACVSTHGKRLRHKLCRVVHGDRPTKQRACQTRNKCLS